jgi:hypothetical protein
MMLENTVNHDELLIEQDEFAYWFTVITSCSRWVDVYICRLITIHPIKVHQLGNNELGNCWYQLTKQNKIISRGYDFDSLIITDSIAFCTTMRSASIINIPF